MKTTIYLNPMKTVAMAAKNYEELMNICKHVCFENMDLVEELSKNSLDDLISLYSSEVSDYALYVSKLYNKYYSNKKEETDSMYILYAYAIKYIKDLDKSLYSADL